MCGENSLLGQAAKYITSYRADVTAGDSRAPAQSMAWAAESPKSGTLSVVLENDAFYGTDRHFIPNGLMLICGYRVGNAPTPEWASLMMVAPH